MSLLYERSPQLDFLLRCKENRKLNDPSPRKFGIDVLVRYMLLFRLASTTMNPATHHVTSREDFFYGANAINLGTTDKTITDSGN